ncbi:hypothetical protein VF12_27900 [Nostoc linckia z15]|nr:hypothetical protein VF12_27900 [Nostoc linckia z15]
MTTSIEQNLNKSIRIPPLESGDRLTRQEFERRYTAMPHVKKAELIEGIVYVASPLRFNSHGKPHGDLIIWLGTYKVATPGVVHHLPSIPLIKKSVMKKFYKLLRN